MAGSAPLEIRTDIGRGRHYASRNYNDIRQSYEKWGSDRSALDWTLTLRQVRRPLPKPQSSASAPDLTALVSKDPHSKEPELTRRYLRREPYTKEPEEGPYHTNTETVERYQNTGNTQHMLEKLVRVSSGDAPSIDWQLNLRGGLHQKPDVQWRRYFTRSHKSFDMAAENCARDNPEYQKSHITPQDRRFDPNTGAISIGTIRKDPISFKRWPGCEGTHVGNWRHLIEDRQRGHKSKRQLEWETTLREDSFGPDPRGSKVRDNRSDGCITEMLGKKKWHHAGTHDPLSAPPPVGDPKLHFLSTQHMIPEPDEDDRERRKRKCSRTDDHISEAHQEKAAADQGL